MFLSLFRLCLLAFEVGEGHVQRFVLQPDADCVYIRKKSSDPE